MFVLGQKGKLIGIISIVIIALVSTFLYFYDFPKYINIKYPAFVYNPEAVDEGEETIVKIDGKLYTPLFKDPYFEGSFIIEHFEATKSLTPGTVVFDKQFRNAVLNYVYFENGKWSTEFSGLLSLQNNFESIFIKVLVENNDYTYSDRNMKISAPATNYKEAIQIENNLNIK